MAQEKLAQMKKDQIMIEYNQNSNLIKEANEICKMLGKNFTFKQIIVQNFVDETGRMSMMYNDFSSSADDLKRQRSGQ